MGIIRAYVKIHSGYVSTPTLDLHYHRYKHYKNPPKYLYLQNALLKYFRTAPNDV